MRVIRGLGAVVTLVVGLIGIPYVLLQIGATVAPADWSATAAWRALLRPDQGSVLVGVVYLVAWLAWLVFAATVLVELLALVTGYRVRIRLPGLAGPQRVVAGMLISAVALVTVPQPSTAQPLPPSPAVHTESGAARTVAAPSGEMARPTAAPPASAPAPHQAPRAVGDRDLIHEVEAGDDLWSLAERYYGSGRDWRTIARANPDRLSGGPDRLLVGWRLRIPDAAAAAGGSVTVRSGDTLSGLAETAYGDGDRWPEIYRANRDRLDDPDELRVGMRLELPSPARARDSSAQRPPSTDPGERGAARQERRPEKHRAPPADEAPRTNPPPRIESPGTEAPRTSEPEPSGRPSAGPASADPAPAPSTTVTDAGWAATSALTAALASVGGLLAAGVVAGLVSRRRLQLQARPLGRRIPAAPPSAQRTETILGRQGRAATLRTLDLAVRAVGAHCRTTGQDPPPLRFATLDDDAVDLHWFDQPPVPPPGFSTHDRRWTLRTRDVDEARSAAGMDDAPRPYPALVSVGADRAGRPVLVDLESVGVLALRGGEIRLREAALLALAVELSFSPWADEMTLTLVGSADRLPAALGKHNVSWTDDVAGLLSRLESRALQQRTQSAAGSVRWRRLDPDLADPWAPEIVLIGRDLTTEEAARLDRLVRTKPSVSLAAVVAGGAAEAEWTLELEAAPDASSPSEPESGDSEQPVPTAVLHPPGLELVPQLIMEPAVDPVLDLVSTTASAVTTPAPWWDWAEPHPPPDNVTYLGKRFGGWIDGSPDTHPTGGGEAAVADDDLVALTGDPAPSSAGSDPVHPLLRILGPVDLLGADGAPPPRAAKQCLEYCGWLLEHPGATARAMVSALAVAEGTRRSNMSRLRSWLGTSADGEAYLPDAYTGRISLHPAVSSDWQRLQILTAAKVNRCSSSALTAALQLVRGAPLANAAPGQWHWAEELRTDMISVIRDIGVELTARALTDHDIDLARWAAARALLAAPGDELLLVARIRTEHQAGNRPEVERLTLQLAAQARQLGVDLDPETVTVLQEVMEGRVRARLG